MISFSNLFFQYAEESKTNEININIWEEMLLFQSNYTIVSLHHIQLGDILFLEIHIFSDLLTWFAV